MLAKQLVGPRAGQEIEVSLTEYQSGVASGMLAPPDPKPAKKSKSKPKAAPKTQK